MTIPELHKPVMVDETIGFLRLKKGYRVLDATVGCGGHANFILEKIKPNGILIGIDRDEKALEIAERQLAEFKKNCRLVHANFRDIDTVLVKLDIDKIDAALFDLGFSSFQIGDDSRGFSFAKDSFLDMRMDLSSGLRAYDIVNKCRRQELENIIRDFGEERFFKRITSFIIERRSKGAITSTLELSGVIKAAVGGRYKSQKIHPATRVFQALRIAVNNELDNIENALGKILNFLRPGARLCVISFHSLEDRIVKRRFREFKKEGQGDIITKKPLLPRDGERSGNPRSRSAKLRVFEKTN
ncbi:MAG: 16S rRNA (cytosine(1402)-N(4))-methyltransferase RsmH [Candidatus Omnitrophica bacterium]|nr:16S rRNA (cytosine(1402)-N(4))-methyltransferase RsmH [Candidatus Omnitrophota bacterium]